MRRLLLLILMCWPLLFSGTICNVVVGQPAVLASSPFTVYSATNDCAIDNAVTCGVSSWQTCHDAATGFQVRTGDSNLHATPWTTFYLSGFSWIGRVFMSFDTHLLPDSCTITEATLYIYNPSDGLINDIQAFAGTQADTPTTADYDSFGVAWSSNIATSTSAWTAITLNSTALSNISKTGATKICIREYDHDASNVPLTSGETVYGSGCTFSESASNKPYLLITFTE